MTANLSRHIVGYAADAMAARGEEANRAAKNEAIKAGNKVREIVLPNSPTSMRLWVAGQNPQPPNLRRQCATYSVMPNRI